MAEVYPERVAPIAYYTGSADPFYTTEGYDRWHSYPPPYLYGGSYVYAWPWLWLDGCPDPGYAYATWESQLLARLTQPAPVALDLGGSYSSSTREGIVSVTLHNQGATTLAGTLHCVLTESELYYVAPNTLEWHHYAMRDMVPSPAGTTVSLAPGEQTVVSLPFQLAATWVEAECDLVCFFQDTTFQPDNTREVWQGAKVSIPELMSTAAVEEEPHGTADATLILHPPQPNPGRPTAEIAFELRRQATVRLTIHDAAGRQVAALLDGRRDPGRHVARWTGETDAGTPALSGVYFCRIEAGTERRMQRLLLVR